MDWFYFSFASALFSALAAIMEKKVLKTEKAFEFTVVLTLFNAALAAMFFPLVNLSNIPLLTYEVVFFKTIINAMAFLCVMYAIKNMELSEALPLLALTPGFVAVIAFLGLGEALSIYEAAGLLMLLAGVYMHGIGAGQKLLGPFKAFFYAKGHRYVLAALSLFTVTAVLDKVVLGSFNMEPVAFMVFENVFYAVAIPVAFFMLGGKAKSLGPVFRNSGKIIIALAAVTITYRYAYILGVKLSHSVALALAVKRTSVFFAVVIGGRLFREGNLKRRIIATAMLVIGALLIL